MTIEDEELGIVRLIPNSRAVRIIVRHRDGEFQLTHPTSISQKEILKTIEEMKPRLISLQERSVPEFVFDDSTVFETLTFDVKIISHQLSKVYTNLKDGTLNISYPKSMSLENDNLQSYIKETIENVCRSEANKILPHRVLELSKLHDFQVGTVKINKSRGRWGSCSSKKNINLSYFCMMLPQHLADFVILHELCHTKEMNHGPRFWAQLDSVSNNRARELTQELKKIKLKW